MLWPCKLLLFLALSWFPLHADQLSVGPAGSGADFEDLGIAVLAAAPGDTICVGPGTYSSTATLEIDKPLAIIGAGSDVTAFRTIGTQPLQETLPLYIHDLAAGELVSITGIHLSHLGFGSQGSTAVVVEDCAGPVILSGVTGVGTSVVFSSPGVAQIRNSSQVYVDGCAFSNSVGNVSGATPALAIEGSTVHVNASDLAGADGGFDSEGNSGSGAPGLRATGSHVRLSASRISGGRGGFFFLFPLSSDPGSGAPALDVLASTVLTRGGAGNELTGGAGAPGAKTVTGAGAPAIIGDAAAVLTLTPDLQLAAGADGDGQVTALGVDVAGAVFSLPSPLATLDVDANVQPQGGAVSFALGGEVNGVYLPFFAFGVGPELELPSLLGAVVLPLANFAGLPAVALDGLGVGQLPISIPTAPVLAGVTLTFQGLAITPLGASSVSAPSFLSVLP